VLRETKKKGREKMRKVAVWLLIAGAALIWTQPASADVALIGDFGSGASVESFEGLSPGPNITLADPGSGYLEPGVVSAFTFPSGVTMTSPVPNPGAWYPGLLVSGVIIGDWSIGDSTYHLLGNGVIAAAIHVPFGTAYMGLDDVASSGPIEFTFAEDMLRAGASVTGIPGTIEMKAYDAGGALLETQTIPSVTVGLWGDNFLGIENSAGIRSVTFGGDFEVLDGLRFEVIPAPGTVLLGAIGLGMVGAYTRKRRLAHVTEG